jgi:hypothetical protein
MPFWHIRNFIASNDRWLARRPMADRTLAAAYRCGPKTKDANMTTKSKTTKAAKLAAQAAKITAKTKAKAAAKPESKIVKTAKALAAKSAMKPAAAKPAKANGNGKENKREICAALLTRAGGCTSRDLLDATGWPAISVPATAKASGLKLRKEKVGKVTTYYGTPA